MLTISNKHTNSNGKIAESYEYDVFGKPEIKTKSGAHLENSLLGNVYMFTARRYDPETGLYYYRARFYSPTLGRFLQTDPIGYKGGFNLYTYCGNNPIILVDPYGFLGFGFGGSATGGSIAGGTVGAQLVVDLSGNVGIYVYAGAGVYVSASGGGMGDLSVYAGKIHDLSG